MLRISWKLREKLILSYLVLIFISNNFTNGDIFGAVAQLGERLDGIQKVVGSIPSSSTKNLLNISRQIFVEILNKKNYIQLIEIKKIFPITEYNVKNVTF